VEVLRITVALPFHRDSVGSKERATTSVAIEHLAKNARSDVRLPQGRKRMENPLPDQGVHQLGFKTRVNTILLR
jgi:hypothetical protein